MEWTADVAAGDWLRDRLDDPSRGTMHGFVPRGFDAYLRIFHPASRDRPVGRPWPELPYAAHATDWDALHHARPQIDDEPVSWATTAAAFGTTMHATAQWHRIVGPRQVENEDGPRDAAGWRYSDPPVGDLNPDLLTTVAAHLAAHTTTPDDGYAALWEGWGGLVGGMGYGPSRVWLTSVTDDATSAQHEAFLAHASRDSFNDVFRKPAWQPGILPDDVSRGPRLNLPDRAHVLFRGGVAELRDAEWVGRMPWRDPEPARHSLATTAHSPSIVWPADRAWVLVTEIDFDSTIVAGSDDAISAIAADPRVEAAPIREGTSLTWDSDGVN